MALATQTVVSDGSLTQLSVSIDYIDREHVRVLFDGVQDGLPWAWAGGSAKQITFSPAVPNGVEVRLIRETPFDLPLHDFSGGAPFLETSMDENFQQMLFIAQEAREGGRISDLYDDLDMHGNQLRNLGQATADGDAVPKIQVEAMQDQLRLDVQGDLNQHYLDIEQFAVRAESARDTAVVYEGNAAASALAASGSASAASGSASSASGFAAAASASEGLAGQHANNAEQYKLDAESAAVLAQAMKKDILNHYYGGSATVPSTRPDGTARQQGDMYFNTTQSKLFIWNGVQWASPDLDVDIGAGALLAANNLSELTNPANARNNLGLGSAAEADAGDFVPAGDPALSDAREWIAPTATKAEAEAGTSQDRRAWTPERIKEAVVALAGGGNVGDMKGSNNLSELTNPATARGNLGLTALATASEGAFGGTLRGTADAGAARTALGLTDLATAPSTVYGRSLVNAADSPAAGTLMGIKPVAYVESTTWGQEFLNMVNASAGRTKLGLETVTQVEAEAGTSSSVRAWSAQRVKQAIEALSPAAPGLPTQIEAEAGVSTTARTWSAERVKQAILALTPPPPSIPGRPSVPVITPGTDTAPYLWSSSDVRLAIRNAPIDATQVWTGDGTAWDSAGFRANIMRPHDANTLPAQARYGSYGVMYNTIPTTYIKDFMPSYWVPSGGNSETWRTVHTGAEVVLSDLAVKSRIHWGNQTRRMQVQWNDTSPSSARNRRLTFQYRNGGTPASDFMYSGASLSIYSDGYVGLGGDHTTVPPPGLSDARFPRVACMELRGTLGETPGNTLLPHGLTGTVSGKGPKYRILHIQTTVYTSFGAFPLPVESRVLPNAAVLVVGTDTHIQLTTVPTYSSDMLGLDVRCLVWYQASTVEDQGW